MNDYLAKTGYESEEDAYSSVQSEILQRNLEQDF
jgi:hypothetical protein